MQNSSFLPSCFLSRCFQKRKDIEIAQISSHDLWVACNLQELSLEIGPFNGIGFNLWKLKVFKTSTRFLYEAKYSFLFTINRSLLIADLISKSGNLKKNIYILIKTKKSATSAVYNAKNLRPTTEGKSKRNTWRAHLKKRYFLVIASQNNG